MLLAREVEGSIEYSIASEVNRDSIRDTHVIKYFGIVSDHVDPYPV